MTTNCIIEPRQSYAGRIFTTGEVGWEGVTHIPGGPNERKDFSKVVAAAQVGAGGWVSGGPVGLGILWFSWGVGSLCWLRCQHYQCHLSGWRRPLAPSCPALPDAPPHPTPISRTRPASRASLRRLAPSPPPC